MHTLLMLQDMINHVHIIKSLNIARKFLFLAEVEKLVYKSKMQHSAMETDLVNKS